MYIFLFLFLVFLAWAVYYLSRRVIWYFDIRAEGWVYMAFALGVLVMFTGIIFAGNRTSFGATLWYRTAALLMGFLLYLLLSVAVMDLLRLFVKAPPYTFGFAALGLTAVVFVYGLGNAYYVRTVKKDLSVKGLEEEIRILHLSDLHLGHFRGERFLRAMLMRAEKEKTDMVCITGDLFDGRKQMNDRVFDLFRQINIPVYFVEGNHELYTGADEIKQRLREAGVTVLDNEKTTFRGLQVVGLRYLGGGKRFSGQRRQDTLPRMREALETLRIEKEKPALLLHHSPVGYGMAAREGFDLFLAGHTHAGQFFPFTVVTNRVHTYNKGLHDHAGMMIYVSQGAGTFGPPMRVGSRSETAVITLRPAD